MAMLVITRWYLPIMGENDPESALQRRPRTFWSLSSHDITGTLDKVIERVLKDASISAESRCERLGLRFFSGIFPGKSSWKYGNWFLEIMENHGFCGKLLDLMFILFIHFRVEIRRSWQHLHPTSSLGASFQVLALCESWATLYRKPPRLQQPKPLTVANASDLKRRGTYTHDGSMVLLYMLRFTINIPPLC